MKSKGMAWFACFLTFSLLVAPGCGGKKHGGDMYKKAPDWVNQGGGAFKEKDSKILYGVGSVSGIKNPSLRTSTSDDRSRENLGKILEIYVSSLGRDYQASTTAGDFSKSSEEQHIERALKTFTKVTLNGSQVVDHWYNENDNTLFSLTRLDLNTFKEMVEAAGELNASIKEYIRQNAEMAFDRLNEEVEKSE